MTFATSYGDIGTALGNSDGLAVLGFFFEVSILYGFFVRLRERWYE